MFVNTKKYVKAIQECLPNFSIDACINYILFETQLDKNRAQYYRKFKSGNFIKTTDKIAENLKSILEDLANASNIQIEYKKYNEIFVSKLSEGSKITYTGKKWGEVFEKVYERKDKNDIVSLKNRISDNLKLINAQEKQTIVLSELFNESINIQRDILAAVKDVKVAQETMIVGLSKLYDLVGGQTPSTSIAVIGESSSHATMELTN